MHNLTAITALGGTEPRIDSHGGVTCAEVPDVALASFTGRLGHEAAARAALAKHLGTQVPEVGKSTFGALNAFWTGPDQWLVEAPMHSHETLAMTLAAATIGIASVTEQTDAWARFDLTGADVIAVLELLCAADTRSMQTGDVTRSAIHHLGCFVHCRAGDHFAIYGPRASAGSLHHAIVTAMHSAL